MNRQNWHLRQNVQVEPLIDQWYAWSYLVPPATAARNMTERHLKILDSYINAPQIHANAVKNPKMLGGPFIDYGGQRVDEIRELRERTKRDRAEMLELSQALVELDGLLATKATGHSLAPLYNEIPACLRGYVELIYDLNNHPSFRIIEPLLYRSKYFRKDTQSLMFSTISGDDRPFVLSTPRLTNASSYHAKMPFSDERIDYLFRLKTEPRPSAEVLERFQPNGGAELFTSFFTPEPPPPYEPYTGRGARWRYFGHACILVETRDINMLFDPVLSYTYEAGISRYTYADLPDSIDYVLITHNHQDHVLFETLLQLRHKIKTVIVPRCGGAGIQDPSLKLLLQHCGFHNVVELGECETIALPDGEILGVPFFGEHCDLDVRSKLAYNIRLKRHRLMFAADSCNIEPLLYANIEREYGGIDALFLGMECDGAPLSWFYGPLLSRRMERSMDESRRLNGSNYEQAIDIVNRFSPREVYVYAMGQEPWLNHVMSLKYTEQSRPIIDSNRLVRECQSRNIVAERLFGEKEILLD